MSSEEGFSDSQYEDSRSSSGQPSQKDLFKEEGTVLTDEGKGKKNRQYNCKTQHIPFIAVPEKIVICIDTSHDLSLGYKSAFSNDDTVEAPKILHEALRVFLNNKLTIAPHTEFALVSVKPGTVKLISDFSSDLNHLVTSLSAMKSDTNEQGLTSYDIAQIFSKVFSSIGLSENLLKSKHIPPENVVRVIFIYNNSYSIPGLTEVDSYIKFLSSPHCIFDVVYLHEAQSDFNSVVKIFEAFSKIVFPRSYLIECSRSVPQVFDSFAKLLAHPYQRVSQSVWEF